MDSKPSFYPKHLAKQYVSQWSENGHHQQQQHVGANSAPPASFPNGQRWTPVGNSSNDASPNSSTSSGGSMHDSSYYEGSRGFLRQPSKKILQGLPDTFIDSMRRLFTLLDVESTGLVHIEEIAENWSQDAVGSVLPPNIVPSLRKVATPDGYLTFERFCAGLKIAILRHGAQRHRQATDSEVETELSRTNSLPNLLAESSSPPASIVARNSSPTPSDPGTAKEKSTVTCMEPPPKPPRDPSRISHSDLAKKGEISGSTASLPSHPSASLKEHEPEFIWKAPPSPYVSQPNLQDVRKQAKKQAELSNRRHTLQGGVDNDMVKVIDQLQHEKSALEDGLRLVQHVDDWYKAQLIEVENKLILSSHQPTHAFTNYTHQERINSETTNIREMNRKLQLLLNPSARASGTDSLAGASHLELVRRIERLQEQNRMLTDEVGRQSTKVTALEQDKRSLIKQLFQQSSSAGANSISSNASTLR